MKFFHVTYRIFFLFGILVSGLAMHFWPVEGSIQCNDERIELADRLPSNTNKTAEFHQIPDFSDFEASEEKSSGNNQEFPTFFNHFVLQTNNLMKVRFVQQCLKASDLAVQRLSLLLLSQHALRTEDFHC